MAKKTLMPVRARHFKDTRFNNAFDCVLSKAAKEHLNVPLEASAIEMINLLIVSNPHRKFEHRSYTEEEFNSDCKVAEDCRYDNTIIKRIALIPLEEGFGGICGNTMEEE